MDTSVGVKLEVSEGIREGVLLAMIVGTGLEVAAGVKVNVGLTKVTVYVELGTAVNVGNPVAERLNVGVRS